MLLPRRNRYDYHFPHEFVDAALRANCGNDTVKALCAELRELSELFNFLRQDYSFNEQEVVRLINENTFLTNQLSEM